MLLVDARHFFFHISLTVIHGKFRRASIARIKFKENAKYIGVRYSGNLDIQRSFKELEQKMNLILPHLYRLFKETDYGSRYNYDNFVYCQ